MYANDTGLSVHAISMLNYTFIKNTQILSMNHGCPFQYF